MTNAGGGDIVVSNSGGPLAITDIGALGYGIEQSASGNILLTSDNQITVNSAIQILGSTGNIGSARGQRPGAERTHFRTVRQRHRRTRVGRGGHRPNRLSAPAASVSAAASSAAASSVIASSVAAPEGSAQTGSISAAAVSAVAPQGSVQLTGSANAIGTIAGAANGSQGFALTDGTGVTVGTVPAVGTVAAATGITSPAALGNGVILQTANAGDITIASPVNAGSAPVVCRRRGPCSKAAGGNITAGSLSLTAGSATGIGSAGRAAPDSGRHTGERHLAGPRVSEQHPGPDDPHDRCAGVVNVNTAGSISMPTAQACDCSPSIAGSSMMLTAGGAMDLAAGSSVSATSAMALYADYDVATGAYAPPGATLTACRDTDGAEHRSCRRAARST